jgi:methionyl-tRNA formyltransferase
MAGERETGVTIMQLVKDLDAGPMLAQVVRVILPDETASDLEAALADIGASALTSVIPHIARGTTKPVPQNDSLATYARRLTREEGLLHWDRTAEAIHNAVRGLYPWPHAYTFLDGQRYIVLRTELAEASPGHAPGTVIECRGDRLVVVCGDGHLIRILQIQPEGRRPMSAREFLAGRPLSPGVRLTASPA